MKHLHFDSLGGASGDMILGALLDLGVSAVELQEILHRLGTHHIHMHTERVTRHGLTGTCVNVDTGDHTGHHHDGHGHHHAHAEHRGLAEIQALIAQAHLPEPVTTMSTGIFERIGKVEASIHNVPVEQIHFHEMGALDSIADIIGACWALHALGIDQVSVGTLPLGHGTIQCAHGTFPSPAPATLELLRGMSVEYVDIAFETVTPTGAGLLASWKNAETVPPGLRVVRIGYGFGHRDLKTRPNVLRATLLEAEDQKPPTRCVMLECNLDDTTPEIIGALCTKLMEHGALDVFTTPIYMKKQRPATLLSVLCAVENQEAMTNLVFSGSTTFGIRSYAVNREILTRRHEMIKTPHGEVRIKIGTRHGVDITASPEFDDCILRAKEHGVEPRQVYQAALAANSKV